MSEKQKPEPEQPDQDERRYIYEERAAIHEFDGKLPRHRAEMRAFLETEGPE